MTLQLEKEANFANIQLINAGQEDSASPFCAVGVDVFDC